MLSATFLLSSLALVPLFVNAEVTPTTPSSLDTYNVGAKCQIAWEGDANAETKDKWKDMSIQLMTGANLDMVHITTVATGQDGSVDGTYEWDCPDVSPNSMIYFYQFRSPAIDTAETQWTTRFTIASSSGETTEPTDETDGIKWGTGALADPASAVPPPDFANGGNGGGEGGSSGGGSGAPPDPSTTPSGPAPSDEPSEGDNEPSDSGAPSDDNDTESAPAPPPSSTHSGFSRTPTPTPSGTNSANNSEESTDGDGAFSIQTSTGLLLASLMGVYAGL